MENGCLICSSSLSHNFTKDQIVKKATKNILKHLLVSKTSVKQIISIPLYFCATCFETVSQVVEIQKKIEILEMQIHSKAEALGNIVVKSPTVSNLVGKIGGTSKSSTIIWEQFKKPLIQNFHDGKLPSPSVWMKRIEKVETKTLTENKFLKRKAEVKKSLIIESKPTKRRKTNDTALGAQAVPVVQNKQKPNRIKIGPKCFLKQIGRDHQDSSNHSDLFIKIEKTDKPKQNPRNKKKKLKIKIGPRSYLKQIGRINKTDKVLDKIDMAPKKEKSPKTSKKALKHSIKKDPNWLPNENFKTEKQTPPRLELETDDISDEELFTEVKLTKTQVEESESQEASDTLSEISMDPLEALGSQHESESTYRNKQIKQWLNSIESPDILVEEEELLDLNDWI